MWPKYDTNNNGALDKDEALKFIEAVLKEEFKAYDKEGNFNETELKVVYNRAFAEIDKDKDDKVTKDEMRPFIKDILNRLLITTDDFDNTKWAIKVIFLWYKSNWHILLTKYLVLLSFTYLNIFYVSFFIISKFRFYFLVMIHDDIILSQI